MDVVPGMDRVQNFRSKKGGWAGSTNLQIISTSRVKSSNLIQTLIAVLRGSADSNQLQEKVTTVAFITIHMACAIRLARPYPNKEKRKELLPFMPDLLTEKLKA
jgi:putative Ca2+/H+ antiporter (TMEM165/GDT1 family)